MKNLLPLLSILLIFSSCSSSRKTNSLSEKEIREGWKLLFDGNSTTGWHLYGQETAGNFWKASDGLLYPDQSNQQQYKNKEKTDLVTDDEYGDFHLKLEWRLSEKGNSGIMFYIKEDKKYERTYVTGPEMQVLDNGTPVRAGHSDARIYTHRAGDLYDLLASKEAVKPVGEWNSVEIKSVNGKLDFFINGVHTLSTTMWNQEWKDMIANSKFKDMPDFGTFKQGRIGLQYHGDAVWFRNIKIRKL